MSLDDIKTVAFLAMRNFRVIKILRTHGKIGQITAKILEGMVERLAGSVQETSKNNVRFGVDSETRIVIKETFRLNNVFGQSVMKVGLVHKPRAIALNCLKRNRAGAIPAT